MACGNILRFNNDDVEGVDIFDGRQQTKMMKGLGSCRPPYSTTIHPRVEQIVVRTTTRVSTTLLE